LLLDSARRRRTLHWKQKDFRGQGQQGTLGAVGKWSAKPTTCSPSDGAAFISPSYFLPTPNGHGQFIWTARDAA